MFKCGLTGKQSKPGQKPERVVLETRPKDYFNKDGKKIGEGTEIVREILVLKDK